MKVTDYQVVGGCGPDDLIKKIIPLLAIGWQPWGSVCANTGPDDSGTVEEYPWQAMVKCE